MGQTLLRILILNSTLLGIFAYTGDYFELESSASAVRLVIHQWASYIFICEIIVLVILFMIGEAKERISIMKVKSRMKSRMKKIPFTNTEILTREEKRILFSALDCKRKKIKSKVTSEQFSLYCELVAELKFTNQTGATWQKLIPYLKIAGL